jgi:radical SAM-linked protein
VTDDPATTPVPGAAGEPPQPRQRWRLVVGRSPDAPTLGQREQADAWEAALREAGLPLARSAGTTGRARVSFGAPLPAAMPADGELIDIVLTERWPAWRVRDALAGRLPDGWRMVDLHDVWLAGPPLPGRVTAADYRIDLIASTAVEPEGVVAACERLVAADRLPRQRVKGGRLVDYDLRPLLVDVRVISSGPPIRILARTRFHPELGTGRPEEVVAALAEVTGTPLEATAIARERLILADDQG